MLTESEVQRSFRILFQAEDFPPENLAKAEVLLNELSPENPLRVQLTSELNEIVVHANQPQLSEAELRNRLEKGGGRSLAAILTDFEKTT